MNWSINSWNIDYVTVPPTAASFRTKHDQIIAIMQTLGQAGVVLLMYVFDAEQKQKARKRETGCNVQPPRGQNGCSVLSATARDNNKAKTGRPISSQSSTVITCTLWYSFTPVRFFPNCVLSKTSGVVFAFRPHYHQPQCCHDLIVFNLQQGKPVISKRFVLESSSS